MAEFWAMGYKQKCPRQLLENVLKVQLAHLCPFPSFRTPLFGTWA